MKLDLKSLDQADAVLFQHGLKALGFYDGTTRGVPGAGTLKAYDAYLAQAKYAATPGAGVASPVARLVSILTAEEGVREIPADSNRGKRVEEYQRATNLGGTGWPWCAAFICWGIKKLGEEMVLPFDRPETAAAWGFEAWAREERQKLFKPRTTIKAGDIVMFTFSHIGFAIADEKNGAVKTVEGNTNQSGSREGGGVYIQSRKTSLIRSHIRLFTA
jgi:hypothetical protein